MVSYKKMYTEANDEISELNKKINELRENYKKREKELYDKFNTKKEDPYFTCMKGSKDLSKDQLKELINLMHNDTKTYSTPRLENFIKEEIRSWADKDFNEVDQDFYDDSLRPIVQEADLFISEGKSLLDNCVMSIEKIKNK